MPLKLQGRKDKDTLKERERERERNSNILYCKLNVLLSLTYQIDLFADKYFFLICNRFKKLLAYKIWCCLISSVKKLY